MVDEREGIDNLIGVLLVSSLSANLAVLKADFHGPPLGVPERTLCFSCWNHTSHNGATKSYTFILSLHQCIIRGHMKSLHNRSYQLLE